MSNSRPIAKLRTKSGCWTCRNRRKKCDEARPDCTRCLQSRRTCIWPTADELTDRRHLVRAKFNAKHDSYYEPTTSCDISRNIRRITLETAVIHHFSNKLLHALINPESSPPYYEHFREQIERYMEHDQCLQHAVLSISASHLHLIDRDPEMRICAMQYYSLAIQQMSMAISKRTHCASLSSLLTSVIMLYINGHVAEGTHQDVPTHVNAAINILELDATRSRMELLTDPLGDLVLESVAFQVFLLAMGSWSRLDEIDDRYAKVSWTHCKRLSQQLSSSKSRPPPRFSPVFGIDFELVTAMIDIKRCFARTISHEEMQGLIANVQIQLDMWTDKTLLLAIDTRASLNDRSGTVTDDLTRLVILAISLFLEHLTHDPLAYLTLPRASLSSWQLRSIIAILETRREDPEWSNSYLGLWPVWTVGIFMQTEYHIELIRDDLQRRWDAIHMSVISRYREDLEIVWHNRATHIDELDGLEDLGVEVSVYDLVAPT